VKIPGFDAAIVFSAAFVIFNETWRNYNMRTKNGKNHQESYCIRINSMILVIYLLFTSCLLAGCRHKKGHDSIAYTRVTIDTQAPKNPWAKMVSDIDCDGQNDIVTGSLWFENQDATNWPSHRFANWSSDYQPVEAWMLTN
jgi:hypothetical protein